MVGSMDNTSHVYVYTNTCIHIHKYMYTYTQIHVYICIADVVGLLLDIMPAHVIYTVRL